MRTHTIAKILEKQNKEYQEALETIDEIIALTLIDGQNTKTTIKELAEYLKSMMLGEEKTKTNSGFEIYFRGPSVPYVITTNLDPDKDSWFYRYIKGEDTK